MTNNYKIAVLASIASAACVHSQVHAQEEQSKPNILLICADDMGWSDIGCYGGEISTPNIDRLAKNGIRFRSFHNTSKSYPSRSCLLTGLYAQQVGYDVGFKTPLANSVTLGEYLKGAGYTTLWSGKHHGLENPYARGFDHYYGLKDGACNYFNPGQQRDGEGMPAQKNKKRQWCIDSLSYAPYTPQERDFYTTDYFTKYALGWLDECKDDEKPFFLYMAYNAPHDPLMAWPEDIAKYKGRYDAGYEAVRNARFEKQKQNGIIDDRFLLSESTHKPWDSLSADQQRFEAKKMEVYAAMIDRLDQNIGKILAKLEQQNKLDNTLIIFVSDNGSSAEVVNLANGYGEVGEMTNWVSLGGDWANVSNTPLRYYKNYSYEGGISTPMIVTWANGLKNPGRTSDFSGHFIDIMATFVDIANAPYPTENRGEKVLPYEGFSFLPVIKGEDISREKPLFWEWENGAAVRHGDMKIVRHGKESKWSLFNLKADPSETKDIATLYPKIVADMDKMYTDWQVHVFKDRK